MSPLFSFVDVHRSTRTILLRLSTRSVCQLTFSSGLWQSVCGQVQSQRNAESFGHRLSSGLQRCWFLGRLSRLPVELVQIRRTRARRLMHGQRRARQTFARFRALHHENASLIVKHRTAPTDRMSEKERSTVSFSPGFDTFKSNTYTARSSLW